MRNCISILRIKQALLELCRIMDPSKITVQDVLQRSGVSRATFYKHFPNIHHLWHTISHDLVDSMAMQLDTLKLSETSGKTRISKDSILRISDLSFVDFANKASAFLFLNREYILFLISEHGDPFFIKKMNWLVTSVLKEKLSRGGYSDEQCGRLCAILSVGMIKGTLDGIRMENKTRIFDSIMTTLEIVYALCEKNISLEQLREKFG